MKLKTQVSLLAAVITLSTGLGFATTKFALPALNQTGEEETFSGTFQAGQFSIPVFSHNQVEFVVLAQIEIQTGDFEQQRLLGRSRARVRAAIIESFYTQERIGNLMPGEITPETVAATLKKDLEAALEIGPLKGVLFNRLLVQETRRGRA